MRLIERAAQGGAKVLFLPEAADYIASNAKESLALAQPQESSPFVLGIRAAARRHGIATNVGIHVLVAVDGASGQEPGLKLLNRSLWVNEDGSINEAATYDKLHLFDYGALRESAVVQAGAGLTAPFSTAVGRVGSLICFDLRFAEPGLALAQPGRGSPFAAAPAQILTFPSAFTVRTGLAHWEVLLRARAIETQTWVIAAAQVGRHNEKRVSYGRSMVVDPWGRVVTVLGGVGLDGEAEDGAVGAIGFAEVDLGEWERIRKEMPLARRT